MLGSSTYVVWAMADWSLAKYHHPQEAGAMAGEVSMRQP